MILAGLMRPEVILAAFMELMHPKAAELPRIALIAVVTEDVAARLLSEKAWPGPAVELSASIATAVIEESGLRRDVHSGELRGKAKEICLVQIHPTNGFWKGITGGDFESMGGTDYESTRRCLTAGALTLRWSAQRCLARHYKTYWREAMWSSYHLGGKCWVSPHRFKRAKLQKRIAYTSWVVTDQHRALIAQARETAKKKEEASPPPPRSCPCTD